MQKSGLGRSSENNKGNISLCCLSQVNNGIVGSTQWGHVQSAQPPWGIETRPPREHRAPPLPLEMPILGEKWEKTKLIEKKCDNFLLKWKGFSPYSLKMQLYALFKAQNYLAAVLSVQREVMHILGLLDHKEGAPLNVSDRYACVRAHLTGPVMKGAYGTWPRHLQGLPKLR